MKLQNETSISHMQILIYYAFIPLLRDRGGRERERERMGGKWDVEMQDWPEGWPEMIEVSGFLQQMLQK